MNPYGKTDRIDSWIIALFLAESQICMSIAAFIEIPYISVIVVALLLAVYVIVHKKISIDKRCTILYFVAMVLLIISILLNGFSNIQEYLLYFIVFGSASLVFASQKINYKETIINTIKIYIVVLAIYFLKSRSIFLASSDYWAEQMGKAYGFVIPVLFSFAFIVYRKKLFMEYNGMYLVLAIVEMVASAYIILFDCGTRGAIVSVLLGCGLIILSNIKSYKAVAIILLTLIAGIVMLYRIEYVINWIASTFVDTNIRPLQKFVFMIKNGNADNGREVLYQNALSYFRNSPIIGNGVGYFENRNNGSYVHEILYELLCEYGVIGVTIIDVFLFRFIKQWISSDHDGEKIFVTILVGISTILIFSSSYWLLQSFWYMVFMMQSYKKRGN